MYSLARPPVAAASKAVTEQVLFDDGEQFGTDFSVAAPVIPSFSRSDLSVPAVAVPRRRMAQMQLDAANAGVSSFRANAARFGTVPVSSVSPVSTPSPVSSVFSLWQLVLALLASVMSFVCSPIAALSVRTSVSRSSAGVMLLILAVFLLVTSAESFSVAAGVYTSGVITSAAASFRPNMSGSSSAFTGMLDSGTTFHLTDRFELLTNPRTVKGVSMQTVSDSLLEVTHVGELHVSMLDIATDSLVPIPPTTIYFCAAQPFTLYSPRAFQQVGFLSPDFDGLVYPRPPHSFAITDSGSCWELTVYKSPGVSAASRGRPRCVVESSDGTHRDTSDWMFENSELLA